MDQLNTFFPIGLPELQIQRFDSERHQEALAMFIHVNILAVGCLGSIVHAMMQQASASSCPVTCTPAIAHEGTPLGVFEKHSGGRSTKKYLWIQKYVTITHAITS